MADLNFIAAIDLGTSHIRGIVGSKDPSSGKITVIASEEAEAAGCIRRGRINNVKETAEKVKSLVRKLNLRLPGSRIERIYVGIGGQSFRSIEYPVSKSLQDEMVTDELMNGLYEECKAFCPQDLEVLAIMPPVCYLDGRPELNPVGILCSRQIEAKYQLIVARPNIRKFLEECISGLAEVNIAGVMVSPLALGDAVLSESDKKLGCALIDFGAGVTTLTVYKNGRLLYLCVIPLGGNLITKDIMRHFGLVESEAEHLKRKHGNAIADKDDQTVKQVQANYGTEYCSVPLAELNAVVEARMHEILENVYSHLEIVGVNDLQAGIVIAGGTANLENLAKVINGKLGKDIRFATVRKGLAVASPDAHPEETLVGLLLNGTQNCVHVTQPVEEEAPKPVVPAPASEPVVEKKDEGKKQKKGKKIVDWMKDFFTEEE
ncbi:MAG: cell division protein FtsA [Bacteroidales bacterium]